MFDRSLTLEKYDCDIFNQIQAEAKRQEEHIELIASENYTSPAVMEAQGSVLTNKYAEGYPAKRYYGGCEYVDNIESLTQKRACELFDAVYANVQPSSGSQANAAVYLALAEPGSKVLGMSLDAGGHLTHGARPSFSGKYYQAIQYGITKEGFIDYEEVRKLAQEHKPSMILAGFSAYSQIIDWAEFRKIADEVGAYLFVDMAHIAGLVAGGQYPSPLPHAHVVTTTTHKTLRGPRGGLILSAEKDENLHKKLNSAIFPGVQGGPLMHAVAAKAVCLKEAATAEFAEYAKQVVINASAMANAFVERGFDVVSGGTKNHLFLVSLVKQGLTGKDADAALGRANITVNKNAVPEDPQSPFVTSGLRIGTPAITTRGFKKEEAVKVANWICDILVAMQSGKSDAKIEEIKQEVLKLTTRFPVYL